jgi:hypothetical protein
MDEAERQLELVRQALCSNLSNVVAWINDRAAARVRNDPDNQGLTPQYITQLVREHVRKGGPIEQRREQRPEYSYRDYWYYVVVPLQGFPQGLFVEMELADDDEDCPEVSLLNAHPERR